VKLSTIQAARDNVPRIRLGQAVEARQLVADSIDELLDIGCRGSR
jgi:hypothetical protein